MYVKTALWRLFLPLLLVLPAMVACGGFQIRVTPAASPSPQINQKTTQVTRPPATTPTATIAATRPPTATPSATPTQVAGLASGKSARVSASGGVNMRDKPNSAARLLGRLAPNITVNIKDGPTDADGFTWWLVDDGTGNVGWVAAGTADDPWLTVEKGSGPATNSGKLVNRAVRLGDRVQVTTQDGKMLTLREAAGTSSSPAARALPGTQFTVRGGPVRQDSYLWWQLEGEQVNGWAAEGEEGDRWLTPVEQ
jgi:SH3-like domain-containing protein